MFSLEYSRIDRFDVVLLADSDAFVHLLLDVYANVRECFAVFRANCKCVLQVGDYVVMEDLAAAVDHIIHKAS